VANSQVPQQSSYFAPEIHSPLIIDQDNTFSLTMSTSADAAGKAPLGPISNMNGSRRLGGTEVVSVQPPKQSDLQVRTTL